MEASSADKPRQRFTPDYHSVLRRLPHLFQFLTVCSCFLSELLSPFLQCKTFSCKKETGEKEQKNCWIRAISITSFCWIDTVSVCCVRLSSFENSQRDFKHTSHVYRNHFSFRISKNYSIPFIRSSKIHTK